MCCGGPPRHVAVYLTEQGQGVFLYAWNLSHIHSEEFIGFGTEIELWMGMSVFLSPFAPGSISFPVGWQRFLRWVGAGLELAQHLLNFQIAVHDLLLIDAKQISRLTEGKQMLRPPVALQRFSDGVDVGSDVWIPQLGELCAVPLSSQDGVHNGTARQPGNVIDDMMDLQVHLRQRLVHVLYVLAGR